MGKVQSEAAGPTAATAQQRGQGEPCRPRVGRTRLDPGWAPHAVWTVDSHGPSPTLGPVSHGRNNLGQMGVGPLNGGSRAVSSVTPTRACCPFYGCPPSGVVGRPQDQGSEDQPHGTVRSSGRAKNSPPRRLRPRAAVPAAGSRGRAQDRRGRFCHLGT